MPPVTIFASTQACPPVLDLALRLRAQGHRLRTLGQLPTPLPARRASLQLELAGLRQDERTIRWVLGQYAEARRLPDAAHERNLQSDLDVTLWQIERVTATLRALEGGVARSEQASAQQAQVLREAEAAAGQKGCPFYE